MPDKLTAASTAYILNNSGDLKAFDKFYQELKKWNRFKIVTSRDQGDVILELTTVSGSQVVTGTGATAGGVTTVTGTAVPIERLRLRILDPATGDVLWSDETDKWVTSGHAPSKLVSNIKKRMPKR